MEDDTTVVGTYVFRGIEYIVTMNITNGGTSLIVEVEDRLTADQWRGTFDSAYIEDLTHKTGNYKQFNIFTSMLESALTQTSDSVTLDLLTYSDLESLRNRKAGAGTKQIPGARTSALNTKRYLILTYTVEFDRIHYPLPLPYMGKPDPRALQETIRHLRQEIKSLKQTSTKDFRSTELDKLKRDFDLLLQEKEDLEAEFIEYKREVQLTSKGSAAKEVRILKNIIKNLEEEIVEQKAKQQRAHSKQQQEYRTMADELEEIKASERNLKVRVRSLTNELAIYKRRNSKTTSTSLNGSCCSRKSGRDSYGRPSSRENSINNSRNNSRNNSQNSYLSHRSTSRERTTTTSRLSARDTSARDRLSSSRDRLSARDRTNTSSRDRFSARDRSNSGERTLRDRSTSRERLMRDRSNSRERLNRERLSSSRERGRLLSNSRERLMRDRSSSRERRAAELAAARLERGRAATAAHNRASSRERCRPRSTSRERGPALSPAGGARFDPTAFVKERERKLREAELKKKRHTKQKMNGSLEKKKESSFNRNGSFGRTSSFDSLDELTNSAGRTRTRRMRPASDAAWSSPDVSFTQPKSANEKILQSTPEGRKPRSRVVLNGKENLPSDIGESDFYDRSAEISEIDARLTRLQQFMKTTMH